ncbi:sterol carrier protein domain-containing protein [Streptomyces sp. MN13]
MKGGSGRITRTQAAGEVRLTRRQLAVWYASGYRTAAAARLSGVVASSDKALSSLIRVTEHEPWLPDHF